MSNPWCVKMPQQKFVSGLNGILAVMWPQDQAGVKSTRPASLGTYSWQINPRVT
jgi:hypothetical protein